MTEEPNLVKQVKKRIRKPLSETRKLEEAQKKKIRDKDWCEANKSRYLERSKAYKEANKEKTLAYKRNWELIRKYGIDLETLESMMVSQNRQCKICGKPHEPGLFGLAVDHCHKTGKVRGLLCRRCNPGLGHFLDSPDLLRRAIAYLEDQS